MTDPTLSDLLAELDALGLRPVQPGEITAPMVAMRQGCSHSAAIKRLRAAQKTGHYGKPILRKTRGGRQVWAWARKA